MKKNILLVDDDELVLFGLEKILENNAFEVETAATATKAVEKFRNCKFDLCLLDFHLPDLNGLELMRIIKDASPETKVIVMTASLMDRKGELSNDIKKALTEGVCQLIPKPFNLCEVTDIVGQALNGGDEPQTEFRQAENEIVQEKRKFPRSPFATDISFFKTVIDQGEVKRWKLQAKAVDLSQIGVGMLTTFPLKESQVVSFSGDLGSKTGLVIWSTMYDDGLCRVGIKFA